MKKVLFSLTMLTVLLSGCVYDDSELFGIVDKNNIEEVGTPLNVTASISEGTSNLRAFVDAFSNGSKIGVFALDAGNASVENTEFAFNGTAWTATPQLYLLKNPSKVLAYFPHSATITSPVTEDSKIPVSIPATNSFTSTQTDYMWATPLTGVLKGTASASFVFKHSLAKLTFVVNKGANYPRAGSLTNITISKGALTGSPEMFVKDGVITGGAPSQISLSGTAALNTTVTAMVVPTASLASTTISLTVDNNTYSSTLPTTASTGVTSWLAGTNHTYTITISAGQMSITTATITPWTAGGSETISY